MKQLNIKTWLNQAAARIRSHSPTLDAELLLASRLDKPRSYLLAFGEETLSNALLVTLEKDLEQLATGYPLAYLLGKKAFWDMDLRVTPATLIPRADTETLIEWAIAHFPSDTDASMVDLGTGSGAIAIALSREFPQANLYATDISEKALAVARENANNWQDAIIQFSQRPWLADFSTELFDLIVSNPPYIASGDTHLSALSYEPMTALTAGHDGLADIEMIIEQAKTCLKPMGWLLLEHGYDQGQRVRDLFAQPQWQSIATYRDLAGNERATCAQRCAHSNRQQ